MLLPSETKKIAKKTAFYGFP